MININNQVIYVTELFANLILGQQDSLARQANVIQSMMVIIAKVLSIQIVM